MQRCDAKSLLPEIQNRDQWSEIRSSHPGELTMSKTIRFGETIPGYDVPVLNEREVRAAAGILFFLAHAQH